jgi:predicted nuclease of restriction endonuclease-like (RecB) superfamily
MKKTSAKSNRPAGRVNYAGLVDDIDQLWDAARRATFRVTNALMTATYWEVGRRIVEFEQGGKRRAEYGDELLERLGTDLSARCGRGFSKRNLQNMRLFYQAFPEKWIWQTLSAKSDATRPKSPTAQIRQTLSAESEEVLTVGELPSGKLPIEALARAFILPWSHYLLLIRNARSPEALDFYHAEALRGGWSVRQLDRQISSLFYERAALSRNKAGLLKKEAKPRPEDALTADEVVRDPLVLEFLNLRDEYSETDLEDALIRHLETFLLELGGDFTFVGRQRRLRIDDEWYRVDLLFFHRRLRCLVIIDLKLGRFTHADAGQMQLYLNYAREHWVHTDENPPVGIILCSSAGESLVRYTLDKLPSKVVAREYRMALPDEKRLAQELLKARKASETRQLLRKS